MQFCPGWQTIRAGYRAELSIPRPLPPSAALQCLRWQAMCQAMRNPDTCWLALDECLWVIDVLYVEGYDLNVYNIRVSPQMLGFHISALRWPAHAS
jgi:hypothetical protein